MYNDDISIPQTLILNGSGGAKTVAPDKAVTLQNSECCFWQQVDYRNPATAQMMINDYKIDQLIVEALCDEDTRPRLIEADNGIALILRGVNLNPDRIPEDMISLRIWIDDKKIITLTHHKIRALATVASNLEKNKGPKSTIQCFLQIASSLTDDIEDVITNISNLAEDLEEEVLEVDNLKDFKMRERLSNLRRSIIAMRRYINPQKDVFTSLHSATNPLLKTQAKATLREISSRISKTIEDIEFAKDHLTVSHEELQSKMSISMSRIMYMIQVVTVIFLPMGLVTSLLGINVRGIPFADKPYGFLVVCGFLMFIGLILITLMRRLRWL